MTKISIIIPTLNEANHIGRLLEHILSNSSADQIQEIIVVDGGSSDDTLEIVSTYDSVRVISSEKGRAKQLNKGAQTAKGDILYFLHADSLPPKGFDSSILEAISNEAKAGCFRLKFDSQHWWLQLAGWFTQFNWKLCRGGDQSLFITKALFIEMGGYDESYVIYEDNILIEQLFKRNTHVVIKKPILSSARRYEYHGVWKLQYHYWCIHLKHRFGASPHDLLSYYQRHVAC